MLSELQLDDLIDELTQVYSNVELQMMLKIIALLSNNNYDKIEGSLEWYVKKLAEVGRLNNEVVTLIAKASKVSEVKLKKMLNELKIGSFDMNTLNKAFDKKLIKIDPEELKRSQVFQALLETSFIDTNGILRTVLTKAIEGSKKAYMNILSEAYISVASGMFSYSQAIQKAIKKLAHKGITVATYKNGAEFSIEPVVRREVLSASIKLSNKMAEKQVEEIGAEFVEVTAHYGARVNKKIPIANHAGWQGKVYHVGGEIEYKGVHYDDFETTTGYGDILGLAGVNCRHRFNPFFPDISVPKKVVYDEAKNEEIYKATQEQRRMERKMRALKKEEAMLDKAGEDTTDVKNRIKKQSKAIDDFCKKNNLQRKYDRERVFEQIIEKPKTIFDKTPKADTKAINTVDYKSIKYDSVDYTQELLNKATPNKMDISIAKEYINRDGEHFYEKDGLFETEDFGQAEIDCANWLNNTFGGNIQLVRRIRSKDGGHISTSDFLWNGKRYDLKSLDNLGKNTISNRTSKSGQAENYIIDIGKISKKQDNIEILAIEQCEAIFKNKHRIHVETIILKSGDRLIKVLKRAK